MQFNPVETFRQEAEELLEEIEQSALSLGSGDDEVVNRLFRAFRFETHRELHSPGAHSGAGGNSARFCRSPNRIAGKCAHAPG